MTKIKRNIKKCPEIITRNIESGNRPLEVGKKLGEINCQD
jgi:hypothetical protein